MWPWFQTMVADSKINIQAQSLVWKVIPGFGRLDSGSGGHT
jgi:hypothetical protein